MLSFFFVSRSGGIYKREDRQPEPLVEVERTFGGAEPRRAVFSPALGDVSDNTFLSTIKPAE